MTHNKTKNSLIVYSLIFCFYTAYADFKHTAGAIAGVVVLAYITKKLLWEGQTNESREIDRIIKKYPALMEGENKHLVEKIINKTPNLQEMNALVIQLEECLHHKKQKHHHIHHKQAHQCLKKVS